MSPASSRSIGATRQLIKRVKGKYLFIYYNTILRHKVYWNQFNYFEYSNGPTTILPFVLSINLFGDFVRLSYMPWTTCSKPLNNILEITLLIFWLEETIRKSCNFEADEVLRSRFNFGTWSWFGFAWNDVACFFSILYVSLSSFFGDSLVES